MTDKRVERRRTRIVMPKVQARIILQTCRLPLAALTAMTTAVVFLCNRVFVEAAEYDAVLPHLELLLLAILLLTATMVVAIVYVAFRFSHRIVGPAYRIIQTLEEAPDDLAVRARIRKGDFLREIAEQLNETLAQFERRVDRGNEPEVEQPAEPVGAGTTR